MVDAFYDGRAQRNSMVLISILKFILGLVLIPTLVSFYYGKGTSTEGKFHEKWITKNPFFWGLLITLVIGIGLEVTVFRYAKPAPVEEEPLKFFGLIVYQEELSQHDPPTSENWEIDQQQLLRKFEHAEYAWNSGDYEEAANALLALKTGRDEVGDLYRIPCFVVNNNLGCVYFELQRNKDFEAFIHFWTAKDFVGSREPYRTEIENNLRKLDNMVNSLD